VLLYCSYKCMVIAADAAAADDDDDCGSGDDHVSHLI
jgi:hypothetical protein